MYLDYYQLDSKPFQITADPKFLWLGDKHKEALATLRYGIVDNRGFLLLTGEVGTGKTILINRLTTLLDIDTVVATLPDPDLNSMDFYNMLADGLQMNRTFDSKGAFLIHLRDFLHQSHAEQKQVLLIIDESQRLNHRLMEDIRVLSNIELHDRKLINIFFVGQQEFNSILMTPQNRALSQRITVRYHIEPLDLAETGAYVTHRLKVAGRKKPIFNQSALDEIFHFSGGIPRLINIISDHALLTGYSSELKRIDGSVIRECAEELRIPIQHSDATAATVKPAVETDTPPPADGVSANPGQASGPAADAPPVSRGPDPGDAASLPLAWKLVYALLVLGLIAVVGYGITQISGTPTDRYNVTDLTPQKYKTTLEREKALLSDRLDDQPLDSPPGAVDIGSREPVGAPEAPRHTEPQVAGAPSQKVASAQNTASTPGTVRQPPLVAMQDTGPPPPASSAQPSVADTAGQSDAAGLKPGTGDTGKGDAAPDDTDDALAPSLEPPEPDTGSDPLSPLPLMDEKVTISFDINSNEIDPIHYELLDQVALYLVQNPEKSVLIRGYTDSSGSPGYNRSVSRFRASAVKSYLIGKGAYPEKMTIIAMGDKNPVAPNTTYEGRIKNRRVEIEFIDPQLTDE